MVIFAIVFFVRGGFILIDQPIRLFALIRRGGGNLMNHARTHIHANGVGGQHNVWILHVAAYPGKKNRVTQHTDAALARTYKCNHARYNHSQLTSRIDLHKFRFFSFQMRFAWNWFVSFDQCIGNRESRIEGAYDWNEKDRFSGDSVASTLKYVCYYQFRMKRCNYPNRIIHRLLYAALLGHETAVRMEKGAFCWFEIRIELNCIGSQ